MIVSNLEAKVTACDKREAKLLKREDAIEAGEQELDNTRTEITSIPMNSPANSSPSRHGKDDAKKLLLKQLDDELPRTECYHRQADRRHGESQ